MASKNDYEKQLQDAAELERVRQWQGPPAAQIMPVNPYVAELNSVTGAQPAAQGVSPYAAELDKVMGTQKSTVDYLLGDDVISAYKKAYLREADRTGRDTLGQYATMTGGIPSTQAVAAASQAADYQKSKLAELMPSLYQQQIEAAMNRWKELGTADDKVAAILGVQVGAPTADQTYQNWNRKMQEDQLAWQKEQFEWQKQQQAKSDSYSLALTLLQNGQMPSGELLTAAGISADDAQRILSAAQSAAYTRSSSGGGGGRSSGGKLKTVGDDVRQTLLKKANKAGTIDAVKGDIARYWKIGYDADELYNWLLTMMTYDDGGSGEYDGGYSTIRPGGGPNKRPSAKLY